MVVGVPTYRLPPPTLTFPLAPVPPALLGVATTPPGVNNDPSPCFRALQGVVLRFSGRGACGGWVMIPLTASMTRAIDSIMCSTEGSGPGLGR